MFAVTTVDSGSKALEFLGLRESNDPNSLETHQVLFFFIVHLVLFKIYNHLLVFLNVLLVFGFKQEVEINLIITDYCMPGMTGYDLLKKVKESAAFRSIPVVIMSSENVPARISR